MSTLDIRNNVVDKTNAIVFAEASSTGERVDIAYKISVDENHHEFLFIEAGNGDYHSIRRTDTPALILALQKAGELGWDT